MHESNQLAHIPGHVGRCSVLTYFAVYRQCQTQLGRTLWKLILGDNPRPYTRGAILAFGRKQIHANTFGAATLQISDRKSTRLNSSHVRISYAVFCLKKKKKQKI